MVTENNTSSLQGCTSVLELEYSALKHQSSQSDSNSVTTLSCYVNNNNVETTIGCSQEKHIREISERSILNDRRGRKSRNLYAVDVYNRRAKERRLNLDFSAV